jgi:adenine-specific DNA-methyltransferase
MAKKTAPKAAKPKAKGSSPKQVQTLTHDEAKRKNIPTAEFQSVVQKESQDPLRVAYERRNRDLDPQLVWRGKDEQDWSDLVVHAPPLYIQEKVHPKALVDDLLRETRERQHEAGELMPDLFADFNGIPKGVDKTEFYQHDQNWSNRMILGDSLQVMASLAEREGLRGKVQCIYFDPPYGIKFNSNFQWSTTSREVEDGKAAHITREPEQVRAFRDTWRDGINSYLSYLRDRLTVCRDLLSISGSVFVQIGDENLHLVRSLLDEIYGNQNFCSCISFAKTVGATSELLPGTLDYVLWYARDAAEVRYRALFKEKEAGAEGASAYTRVETSDGVRRRMSAAERGGEVPLPVDSRIFTVGDLTSARVREGRTGFFPITIGGREFLPAKREWSTNREGIARIKAASRIERVGQQGLGYVRFLDDFPAVPLTNLWSGTVGQNQFGGDKVFVVQTALVVVRRCVLMTTDAGDLVLDPTCGSGTTATVAEQWGRRWITIDTSRVALALARARVMGARYPSYILADSREGQIKEAEVNGAAPSQHPTYGSIRHGFVYERVPHVTLKSIANNAEIDVIWEKWQETLEPLREQLNTALEHSWEEWEIPRDSETSWPASVTRLHSEWWEARIARQKEIDASIAAHAEFEYLYDRPYEDKKKVRVAGPFTVESLSPHRTLGVDEDGGLIDTGREDAGEWGPVRDFTSIILENLKAAGVQQAHKSDRITFESLKPWPGAMICAEGRYHEGETERRAAVFIGPEFGTVSRPDLVQAAREAGDADFDVLIACAFNYDAHSSEFEKLGRIPVLKARMNADLHMAEDLKATGKGNLFVIFGEPDIDILDAGDGKVRVKVKGVDVFDPNTGEVRSDSTEGIACWFIDTDYNEESFFVRHAYFLGANDPYKALKTTLKAEINEAAWATLNSDTSRAFPKPTSGRIAVKVINHLGDEVMKVFRVS